MRRLVALLLASLNRGLDRALPRRLLRSVTRGLLPVTRAEVLLSRGHPALDGFKIAFLSDLHAGSFLDARDLLRIFEAVYAEEPDLCCLGGDLINTREREILLYRDALALAKPRHGIVAVPGNHDHFWGRDIGLFEAFLEDHGVSVLVNRGVTLEHDGAKLFIAGVDDLTEGEPHLEQALASHRSSGHDADTPVLLLAHHPDFFFEAAAAGVDLTLSGHTHGGQVRVFGWAPIRHSRFGYMEGEHEVEGCRLFVSRGVGVTLLPVRIGAPAEILLLTLRRAR